MSERGNARVMTSLAQLVGSRRDALGKSYRTIAVEAGVAVATVHKITQGKLTRVPSPKTIDGLARALEVPAESLRQAAAADIGLREFVLEEGERQAIYLATEELSVQDRRFILDMINRLREHGASPISATRSSVPAGRGNAHRTSGQKP